MGFVHVAAYRETQFPVLRKRLRSLWYVPTVGLGACPITNETETLWWQRIALPSYRRRSKMGNSKRFARGDF